MVQQALCLQLMRHGTCLNDLHQRSHPHTLLNQLHSTVTLGATSSTWDKVKSGKKKSALSPWVITNLHHLQRMHLFVSGGTQPEVHFFQVTKWGICCFYMLRKIIFVTLTVILISSGPSSLFLSWPAYSQFTCWPVKQKQESKPDTLTAKRESKLSVFSMQLK